MPITAEFYLELRKKSCAKKSLNGKNLDCLRAFPTHEFELLLEFFRNLLGAA